MGGGGQSSKRVPKMKKFEYDQTTQDSKNKWIPLAREEEIRDSVMSDLQLSPTGTLLNIPLHLEHHSETCIKAMNGRGTSFPRNAPGVPLCSAAPNREAVPMMDGGILKSLIKRYYNFVKGFIRTAERREGGEWKRFHVDD